MPHEPAEESAPCPHCGLGAIGASGACLWCGATAAGEGPTLLPWRGAFWRAFTGLPGLKGAAARGPVRLACLAGVYAGLVLALLSGVLPLPGLATGGFFAREQWWWILLPEMLQTPVIAAARGAMLGLIIAALRPWRERAGAAWLARGASIGLIVTGVVALAERAGAEGLLFTAAGGAFIGAAVDQATARWRARAPRAAGDAPGTSRAHSP